jgi:hypothetical protein
MAHDSVSASAGDPRVQRFLNSRAPDLYSFLMARQLG